LNKKALIIIIIFFSTLQAANTIITFFSQKDQTEILIENEDNEKTCKEDYPPLACYELLSIDLLSLDFSYLHGKNSILDINLSKSYLTKPETPPPNIS